MWVEVSAGRGVQVDPQFVGACSGSAARYGQTWKPRQPRFTAQSTWSRSAATSAWEVVPFTVATVVVVSQSGAFFGTCFPVAAVRPAQPIVGCTAVQCAPLSCVHQIVGCCGWYGGLSSTPSTSPSRRLKNSTWLVPASDPAVTALAMVQIAPPSWVTSNELRAPTRYTVRVSSAAISPR